jgi:hypothetical protein
MRLTERLPWILTAIFASVFAFVSGVHAGLAWFSWLSVALFALCILATGFEVNRNWWGYDRNNARSCGRQTGRMANAALQNAQLMVLAYLWGAVSMIAVYRLTGLRWQHGLQYGVGMALIATLHLAYAWLIAIPGSPLRSERALQGATILMLAHGGAAATGIVFLVLTGKITSAKVDWAANQVFTAGGLAVAGLSAIGVLTSIRLLRGHPRRHGEALEARKG